MSGWTRSRTPEAQRIYFAQWYAKNRERRLAQCKIYAAGNREKIRAREKAKREAIAEMKRPDKEREALARLQARPGKRHAKSVRRYAKDRENQKAKASAGQKFHSSHLTDNYISGLLVNAGLFQSRADVPMVLVEAKRLQIKLLRAIRQNRKAK